jgi:hypothetical protein
MISQEKAAISQDPYHIPRSPFTMSISLPSSELRNMIYAYALAEYTGITVFAIRYVEVSQDALMGTRVGDEAFPINQLKYVDREVYNKIVGT